MTPPGPARIAVAVGPGPGSADVVRAAASLAASAGAPLVAIAVDAPGRLSELELGRMDTHLALAASLGAEVVRVPAWDVAGALVHAARARHARQLVVGKPTHPRWRDLITGSLLDDLVRRSGSLDLVVVTAEDPAAEGPALRRIGALRIPDLLRAAAIVTASTAVGRLGGAALAQADVVVLYLLGISVCAWGLGRVPSLFASALSVMAYNLFFVPPIGRLHVQDTRHLLTFAMLFGAGLVISHLAARLRGQQAAALGRERETASLLLLSRELAAARDHAEVAAAVAGRAEGVLGTATRLEPSGPIPVAAGGEQLGALVPQGPVEGTLAGAVASLVALAIARVRDVERAQTAELDARVARTRADLLSAVSHDLRTPLAAIAAAAHALGAPGAPTQALAGEIQAEVLGMDRLVRDLLDMTRVQGGLVLRREWIPVEELVGAALRRVAPDRRALVQLDPDIPLVPVEEVLVEHALANLLENAVVHAPGPEPIEVRATRGEGVVAIEVLDRGPGLPPGDPERLFEPFVRGGTTSRGTGLGLAVCRGIVVAHGGNVRARRREGGGAEFRVELPIVGEPPPVPPEVA